MSLINDALKRAKQVQTESTPAPAPEPEFRPVDPQEADPVTQNLVAPIIISVIAVLALLFIWRSFQGSDNGQGQETIVSARSPEAASEPEVPSDVDPDIAQAAQPLPTDPELPSVVPATAAVDTKLAVIETVPKGPRLQAVVYHPKRPSAIIDGKTVFIGDNFEDFRVAKISKTSVTLSSGKEQLVLKLP
jgi:hypothetical protein